MSFRNLKHLHVLFLSITSKIIEIFIFKIRTVVARRNYGFITIPNSLAKLVKKTKFDKLIKDFTLNGLLSELQRGSRAGKPTECRTRFFRIHP